MSWFLLWRLVHFAGIVLFVAGHGVSVAVTLELRRERDPARLEALLALSRATIAWSNLGLLVLLVGGIGNWVIVDYPRRGWLWASAAILALLAVAGVGLASPYFRRVRAALADPDGSALEAALSSSLPAAIFWLETAGTAAIVWLMVYKPF